MRRRRKERKGKNQGKEPEEVRDRMSWLSWREGGSLVWD